MHKQIFLWGPVLIWMGFIFYLSSIPHLQITSEPVGNFISRKLAHLVEYAVLYLLVFRAQGYRESLRAILIVSIYAVTDEFHQGFVPSRTPRWYDVAFDISGAILGAGLWKLSPQAIQKLKI